MKPSHRSSDGLTKADKKAMRPQNLLKRDFTAKKPNEKCLTDITQIPCKGGKLYIAPIFDCFGGEIISLEMDTNMKKEKLYRMNTTKMKVEQVKSIVFRYVMIYYNRKRISTVNPGGLPPSIYREKSAAMVVAASETRVFSDCTKIDFFISQK